MPIENSYRFCFCILKILIRFHSISSVTSTDVFGIIIIMINYEDESAKFAGYVKNIIADSSPGYMIKTFGCQMNESDSEKIAGLLESMGYTSIADESLCSFIIFNTCCVRESAEQKLFGHLGEMKKLKADSPKMIIAVCGCMMQQEGMAARIKKSYPYADIVFGANSMHLLPKLLYKVLTEHKRQFEVQKRSADVVEGIPAAREYSAKAYVPIMHGCNNFCSYCIVPYVRGREVSRRPGEILEEIGRLAESGVKEIILLGQNVNSYDGGISFSKLLRKIGQYKSIERIRFMTSHPKDMGVDLIEAIRDTEKVCNHLHLPVQSGSSRILEKMNRNYTKNEYIEKLKTAKKMIPGIGLSTDIIVGFPGETEEDFLETIDVLEQVKFDFAFTFIYSKRKGTPAEKMTDEVPEDVKHDRFNRLLEVQNRITFQQNELSIGKMEVVMVEGESKTTADVLTGRTESNKIVNFTAPGGREGDFAKILITDAKTWHLEGEFKEWK